MKSTFSPEDQEIIELLKGLKSVKTDYPPTLLAHRRVAFIKQIEQREKVEVKKGVSLRDQDVIKFLDGLKSVKVEYPPTLLAQRRIAFIKQIEQQEKVEVKKAVSLRDRDVIKFLGGLKSVKTEYPPTLLAQRRFAFIKQIEQREKVGIKKASPLQNQDVISLLKGLRPVAAEYPQELLAQRRAAFNSHVLQRRRISWREALFSNIQNKLIDLINTPRIPMLKLMQTSLIVSGIVVATFLGSLIFGNHESLEVAFNPSPTQREVVAIPISASATATSELAQIICKPGYEPPLCLAKKLDNNRTLTFQGNGHARAAVAKDTILGYGAIHQASYVNDGFYGSGASWVSNSAYSWIKIDLGDAMTINTVMFGKDRLGNLTGHDPGHFTIAVALSDNVYANGDSSNDEIEYTQIYNSQATGFTGVISGSQTLQATFTPILARYIKITVTNPGAAIDEVEAFLLRTSSTTAKDEKSNGSSRSFATSTSIPTRTFTVTLLPTSTRTLTPIPTDTSTSIPTDTVTPIPTDTPMPVPTSTPLPINTSTSVPTSTALPANTSTSVPSSTPLPADTSTSIPSSTPIAMDTLTSVP